MLAHGWTEREILAASKGTGCNATGCGCTVPPEIIEAYHGWHKWFDNLPGRMRGVSTLPPPRDVRRPAGKTDVQEIVAMYDRKRTGLHEASHAAVVKHFRGEVSELRVRDDGTGYCRHSPLSPRHELLVSMGGYAGVCPRGSTLRTMFRDEDLGRASGDCQLILEGMRAAAVAARGQHLGLPAGRFRNTACDLPDGFLIDHFQPEFEFVQELLAKHRGFIAATADALAEGGRLLEREVDLLWDAHLGRV
jgi:hypothetical protein